MTGLNEADKEIDKDIFEQDESEIKESNIQLETIFTPSNWKN